MKTLIAVLCFSLTLPAILAGQSMDAASWSIRFGRGMPRRPAVIDSGWFFVFPQAPGHVNYITTPYDIPLSGWLTMSLKVVGVEAPFFDFGFGPKNPCETPASVRFYFQRKDSFASEFSRWWSHSVSYVLDSGEENLAVSLDPTQWLSVMGKKADANTATLAAFERAKQTVGYVGMTFGGGCAFGHGVSVYNGTAVFILRNYKVLP